MSVVFPGLLAAAAAVSFVIGLRTAVADMTTASARCLDRIAWGRALRTSLARAGLPLGPDGFAAAVTLAALIGAAAVWRIIGTAIGGVIVAAATFAGAAAYVGSAERRYLDRFGRQLPLVAQQLSGSLGAGMSFRQAIERSCRDVPAPAAEEFGRLAGELRLGARLDAALEEMARRLPDPGLELMVAAILIQRGVGGNLAGALARLSGQLDDRGRLMREASSATAQARMSAWLVASLPAVGGLAVELAAPGTLERTLGQGPGRLLLGLALLLEFTGVVLVRRISATATGGA